jgi:hypothetical protein
MEPISGLKAVRDYCKMRSYEEALGQMVRCAKEASGAIDQRAKAFRKDAVRVLGPEAFQEDRHRLLLKLEEYMREWGLNNLHTNMDKIIDTVAADNFVLRLPLVRLQNVTNQSAAAKEALYDFLARAIDSIVVRVVLNSSPDEIKQALQHAAAIGEHPEAFGIMEVFKENLPYNNLKGYTFQWLDTVIKHWLASTHLPEGSKLRRELLAPENAPSFASVPLDNKLNILKGKEDVSGAIKLLRYDVKPLVKTMDRGNNVGDVLNAVFEAAVRENGMNWWSKTGRYINWKERQEKEEQAVPPTDEQSVTERVPQSQQSDDSATLPGKRRQ